jgi:hypothetical protein
LCYVDDKRNEKVEKRRQINAKNGKSMQNMWYIQKLSYYAARGYFYFSIDYAFPRHSGLKSRGNAAIVETFSKNTVHSIIFKWGIK